MGCFFTTGGCFSVNFQGENFHLQRGHAQVSVVDNESVEPEDGGLGVETPVEADGLGASRDALDAMLGVVCGGFWWVFLGSGGWNGEKLGLWDKNDWEWVQLLMGPWNPASTSWGNGSFSRYL